MITPLIQSNYQSSKWKNGNGTTSQIAIFPIDATLAECNFVWRISSATISKSSAFSKFPRFERQLIIWKGAGVKLNESILNPDSPFIFSGEENIYCEMLKEEIVVDLGIIYNKEKIKVFTNIMKLSETTFLKLSVGTHFFFLAKGDNCTFNNTEISYGDSILIENINELEITSNSFLNSQKNLVLYHIHLY
jgi:environmental stress-induced protein Ves